jgi:uncharacterized protein YbjT (DUF2867 family)
MRILLTGATGYVGGVLLQELEARGHAVRCLARRPGKLDGLTGPGTEVIAGDAADPEVLARACNGVDVAYWLVHSMESGVDFERSDRLAAERFAAAASAAGVRRIIYLGGLGAEDDRLSAHLRSRHEVGAILRASGLDVVEFRASIVIGAGSFSFDLVRTLVERLPVMICPAWLATPTQPIAIADVVAYLAAAVDLPSAGQSVVWRYHAGVCPAAGPLEAHDSGACADAAAVEPVAETRHSKIFEGGSQVDRRTQKSDRRHERCGGPRLCDPAPIAVGCRPRGDASGRLRICGEAMG